MATSHSSHGGRFLREKFESDQGYSQPSHLDRCLSFPHCEDRQMPTGEPSNVAQACAGLQRSGAVGTTTVAIVARGLGMQRWLSEIAVHTFWSEKVLGQGRCDCRSGWLWLDRRVLHPLSIHCDWSQQPRHFQLTCTQMTQKNRGKQFNKNNTPQLSVSPVVLQIMQVFGGEEEDKQYKYLMGCKLNNAYIQKNNLNISQVAVQILA